MVLFDFETSILKTNVELISIVSKIVLLFSQTATTSNANCNNVLLEKLRLPLFIRTVSVSENKDRVSLLASNTTIGHRL